MAHSTLRVTVLDGQAHVELIAGDGGALDAVDAGRFQVVGEGEALSVGVSIGRIRVEVKHPDLDLLIEHGMLDMEKLKVTVSPPRLLFEMTK